MQDFTHLGVWRKAHALTLAVYHATQRVRQRDFPGLVPQLRRSAASIPANIAEGCGHATQRELACFLQIAMASAFELEYHLILAADLGTLPSSAASSLRRDVREVKRMLTGLIKSVRKQAERDETRSEGPRDTDD